MQVKKSVTVSASAERAFDLFTSHQDSWWPRKHHIGPTEEFEVLVEPKVGGRWYEHHSNGAECDWGAVLAWDPPLRVLLDWQLNSDWEFDPTIHTEVEVTFTEIEKGLTKVDLEHRRFDAYGEKAPEMQRAFDGENGWSYVLDAFANKVAAE